MADTNIEWADKTWNPIIGCTKVSAGCDHCYAERMACRLALNPQTPQYQNVVSLDGRAWNGKTALVESALMQPLKWKKPSRIFVGSMTDLFHRETPDEWLDRIFAVMALCPQHTFMVLTKRPEGMREYLGAECREKRIWDAYWEVLSRGIGPGFAWPLPNVWLGVTAENQAMADYRIMPLLGIQSAVHFVSIEPMLGPIKLDKCWVCKGPDEEGCWCEQDTQASLRWVICGCESGPGARLMDIAWARSLKDQCVEAGVPFFYKQGPGDDGRVVKMPVLDGRAWDQRP
jgi:protein gp37